MGGPSGQRGLGVACADVFRDLNIPLLQQDAAVFVRQQRAEGGVPAGTGHPGKLNAPFQVEFVGLVTHCKNSFTKFWKSKKETTGMPFVSETAKTL